MALYTGPTLSFRQTSDQTGDLEKVVQYPINNLHGQSRHERRLYGASRSTNLNEPEGGLLMIFSCFRSKKDKKPTESRTTPSETTVRESRRKDKNRRPTNHSVPVTVKLAPRTTLLQTPKQDVGSRITEATLHRRAPNLQTRYMNSRFRPEPHSSIARLEFPPQSCPGVAETLNPPPEAPQSPRLAPFRPLSPTAGYSLLGSNSQQDELRQALARRAAKNECAPDT